MAAAYTHHLFAPYRICPVGAHVDHQHGLVTGFALDKGVDLWFDVTEDGSVDLPLVCSHCMKRPMSRR